MKSAFLLLLCLTLIAGARPPVDVPHSRSPDGRFSLVLVPAADEFALPEFHVRDLKTGALSRKFTSKGYGSEVGEDSIHAVLWSPDGRSFALSYPMARGYMGNSVHARWRGGWIELTLPDYLTRIFKRNHVNERAPARGCETPKEWLPGRRLRLEVANAGITEKADEDNMKIFWVAIKIIESTRTRRPIATLEEIKRAPQSAEAVP